MEKSVLMNVVSVVQDQNAVLKKVNVIVMVMLKIVMVFAVVQRSLINVMSAVDQVHQDVIVLVTSKVAMMSVTLVKFMTYVMYAVEQVFQKVTVIASVTL